MNPLFRVLRVLAVTALIVASYLWVAADDWEIELEQQQRLEQQQQEQAFRDRMLAENQEPEFEPDWSKVQAEDTAARVFAQAQRTLKKNTVKAKRKIKSRK